MPKKNMGLLQRGRAAKRIFEAVLRRECFLLLGHKNPDDDCVASLVAAGLLLKKLHKQAHVYFGADLHEHFGYLLSICRYNQIGVLRGATGGSGAGQAEPGKAGESGPGATEAAESGPGATEAGEAGCRFDTVIVCDTPKPDMIDAPPWARSLMADHGVLTIEIDHHLGADSDYCGDAGYRLVTEASSASELVGRLALLLRSRRDLLIRYQMEDPFSRNFVLAVLTGIIGDSKMGQFLKSSREKRYYRRFSAMFNRMLSRQTVRESNLADAQQVFRELQKLSAGEQKCFEVFLSRKRRSPSVAWIALGEDDLARIDCDSDTTVSVARAAADLLAEESGKLGLVAYNEGLESLAQFRLRRSRNYTAYDLRNVLPLLGIRNGGGHEGAIGFRFPLREVPDIEAKAQEIVERIERILPR